MNSDRVTAIMTMNNNTFNYSNRFRGVGTGEASEARASPEIRAFTIEKF